MLASQLPSIVALCERYGVAHLELFGSATGPDFTPGSRARRWIELAESLEELLGRAGLSSRDFISHSRCAADGSGHTSPPLGPINGVDSNLELTTASDKALQAGPCPSSENACR
jgi:hypothetical protein